MPSRSAGRTSTSTPAAIPPWLGPIANWEPRPAPPTPPVCPIPLPWRSTPAATCTWPTVKRYGEQVRAGKHDGQRRLLLRCVRSRRSGVRLQRQPVRRQRGQQYGEEFAPGSTTASAIYSAGVDVPDALAFDSSGNLYVAKMPLAKASLRWRSSRRGARRPAPPTPPVLTIPKPWRSTPAATCTWPTGATIR